MNCHWPTSLLFLLISLDLLTILACSCILFRCYLIWHHFCWLHRNHFHRRVALLPTLPRTIVSLRKFILYFISLSNIPIVPDGWFWCLLCHSRPLCHSEDLYFILVKYSYSCRLVVLVRIPLRTRRRSSPPLLDFLTSYLEKTALGNWTGLYLVFVFVFVFLFHICICILASIGLHKFLFGKEAFCFSIVVPPPIHSQVGQLVIC